MKKRVVKTVAFLAAFAVFLSGCGTEEKSAKKEDAGTSETVELTLWGEKDNIDMLQQMVDSFEEHYAEEADFNITIEEQADAKVRDVMLMDIHNAADVFSFPDDQLISLVAAGGLVPVPNAEEIRSANLEESVEAATLNDTLYAYPMTADNGYFLYYNKQYFTEDDVQSLERILQIAQGAGKQFSMEFDSGWYSYTFFGNTGLTLGMNDDGVTNYCDWNATEGEIKGTDIANALLTITANPAFANRPDGEFVEAAKSGEVIAGISGVWNVMGVKEAWGEDYGAVKLPTYTCAGKQVQMASFTGYKMMGVNAYSQEKEWACRLADWLTNEENQQLRFVERNQGPSNKNAAASDEVKKVQAIQAVIEQSQYGSLQRVGNSYWDACSQFANTILQGSTSGLQLQEVMDALVAGITASTIE